MKDQFGQDATKVARDACWACGRADVVTYRTRLAIVVGGDFYSTCPLCMTVLVPPKTVDQLPECLMAVTAILMAGLLARALSGTTPPHMTEFARQHLGVINRRVDSGAIARNCRCSSCSGGAS